jgi:hypothetical protein
MRKQQADPAGFKSRKRISNKSPQIDKFPLSKKDYITNSDRNPDPKYDPQKKS